LIFFEFVLNYKAVFCKCITILRHFGNLLASYSFIIQPKKLTLLSCLA